MGTLTFGLFEVKYMTQGKCTKFDRDWQGGTHMNMILEIKRFNRFAKREQGRKDFQQIRDFAMNDFFTMQTEADKKTIAGAYAKIERNTAGRYDLQIVMDYWKAARAAWSKR